MRKILCTIFGVWLCGLLAAVGDETFPLADGTTVSGDIVSFTENGIIFRADQDKYTDRLPWIKFSQAGLKQLAQNPKIEPLVEPFIIPPPAARAAKPEVQIQDMSQFRLERPAAGSLFGALFSSSVGLVVLLLIYAGNLFAGYEIARYRAKPLPVVMGVAAVLPVLGPIIFLSMIPPREEAAPVEETPAEVSAGHEEHRFVMPGATPSAAPAHEEIHIVAGGWQGGPPPEPAHSQAEIFQRGQFMFNRRFFETKFPGFFGVVRTGEGIGKVLTVKTSGALLTVERISRITANDVYFEVLHGAERREITVPFSDIQQIQLKAKNA